MKEEEREREKMKEEEIIREKVQSKISYSKHTAYHV